MDQSDNSIDEKIQFSYDKSQYLKYGSFMKDESFIQNTSTQQSPYNNLHEHASTKKLNLVLSSHANRIFNKKIDEDLSIKKQNEDNNKNNYSQILDQSLISHQNKNNETKSINEHIKQELKNDKFFFEQIKEFNKQDFKSQNQLDEDPFQSQNKIINITNLYEHLFTSKNLNLNKTEQIVKLIAQIDSNRDYYHNCLYNKTDISAQLLGFINKNAKIFDETMFARDPEDGLAMLNKEIVNKQRSVLGYILKSLAINFFKGKSLMSVSFPVTVFERKTVLERVACTLAYAPIFLEEAGQLTDTYEQFKKTIAFFISAMHLNYNQEKPFNPILGETYQCYVNGIQVCFEQVSHHPPISSFYVNGKHFKYHGYTEIQAHNSTNSVKGIQIGNPCIEYPNTNTSIYYSYPRSYLGGTLFGKRTFNLTGSSFIYDKKSKLLCELEFAPKKKDALTYVGYICKANDSYLKKIEKSLQQKKYIDIKVEDKDIQTKICTIEGNWLDYIKIDNKIYWQIEQYDPYEIINANNPLPSDSVFRKDNIYLKLGDLENSQIQKEKLEEQQRYDRKLREQQKKFSKYFFDK